MTAIDAEKTAKVIYDKLILRFGCPSIIRMDNESNLKASLISELLTLMDITPKHEAPYHPQSQSRAERWKATLMESVSMFCQGRNKPWSKQLQSLVFAYNMSVHSSTLEVPFNVVILLVLRYHVLLI